MKTVAIWENDCYIRYVYSHKSKETEHPDLDKPEPISIWRFRDRMIRETPLSLFQIGNGGENYDG